MAKTMEQTRREYDANNPPIEVGQIWGSQIEGKPFRKLRIIAPYPTEIGMRQLENGGRLWIYELVFTRNGLGLGEMSTCPEFNLRYVYELEAKRGE